MAAEIRLSLLASGETFVDGIRIRVSEIDAALETAKLNDPDCVVLYYRENEAPPQTIEAMKAILKHRLGVSFSTKPDFSDYINRFGQSRPREAMEYLKNPFKPHLPDVYEEANLDAVFQRVRLMASSAGEDRGVIVVKPDRSLLAIPKPERSPQLDYQAQAAEKIIPSVVKRGVVAIGNTAVTMREGPQPGVEELNRAIPFFGMLLAFSYAGHAVWVFEGQKDALQAACKGAGMLIVDSAMLPYLSSDWEAICSGALRASNILVYDRHSSRLVAVRLRPKAAAF